MSLLVAVGYHVLVFELSNIVKNVQSNVGQSLPLNTNYLYLVLGLNQQSNIPFPTLHVVIKNVTKMFYVL